MERQQDYRDIGLRRRRNISKKEIYSIASIFLITVSFTLVLLGTMFHDEADRLKENKLYSEQTLSGGIGKVSVDLLSEHYYDIEVTVGTYSSRRTSIIGSISILTLDYEVLDKRDFHKYSEVDLDEDSPSTTSVTESYHWYSGILATPLTIQVEVEVTSLVGELRPTIVSIYEDIDHKEIAEKHTIGNIFIILGIPGICVGTIIYIASAFGGSGKAQIPLYNHPKKVGISCIGIGVILAGTFSILINNFYQWWGPAFALILPLGFVFFVGLAIFFIMFGLAILSGKFDIY